MKKMWSKLLMNTSEILVLIGALVWGIIGIFNYNVVNALLGGIPWLEKVVYSLVGISGIYLIVVKFMKKR